MTDLFAYENWRAHRHRLIIHVGECQFPYDRDQGGPALVHAGCDYRSAPPRMVQMLTL